MTNPHPLPRRQAGHPLPFREREENRGFTLVEATIAITILAVAIVPIMYAFDLNMMGSTKAKLQRIAMGLAVEEMETIKNEPVRESQFQNKESKKTVGNNSWHIVREIVEDTDPLEIHVRVYREGEPSPAAHLFTLREDLEWKARHHTGW